MKTQPIFAKRLRWTLSAGIVLAAALVAVALMPGEERSPASLAKTSPEHPRWSAMNSAEYRAIHKAARKSEGLILSEVSADREGTLGVGQSVTLTGRATAKTHLDQLHYAWILPDGVRVLEGETSGSLANVAAGEAKEFQLKIESSAAGNHRVIFRAYRVRNGESVGNSATYFTGETDALRALGTETAPLAPRSPEEFRKRAIQ